MIAVLKLRDTPKEGFFKLSFISGDTDGFCFHYPEFFKTKFTKINCKLEKDKYYLVKFSVSIDQDKDKKDLKRGKLFLRSVELVKDYDVEKERFLGTSYIKGTIVAIKHFSLELKHKELGFLTQHVTFSRIKLNVGKAQTYIGNYNPEIKLNKGDFIDAKVNIFCKRAYDEKGKIDMSDENTYKNKDGVVKSKGYTELKIIKATIIPQDE